ncbi:protein kinase [Variovorax sp. J22P168]|uniref:leucine-rich repeat-containing protein kinase family protein n=1 Tax=Variovorax jilinensis TaxID=3053513 RepID=UPI002576C2E9|nr:protein kinase [Variovorax sp. J22P168]MDM0012266.1 protein kinase [Variovorax sp. J22P168]
MTMLERLRAGELVGTQRLDLSAGLAEFPPEIFGLADTLEVLNLSGNALSSLPADLHRLHRLRVLFCSDNRFTELPEALGRCERLEMVGFKANRIERVATASLPPALRWLILTDNRIETLPEALGQRPRLQKLMLAGNRLRALPASMAAGSGALELLRISANRFEALPDGLAQLPRLSWLAFAGNPFDETPEARTVQAQATAAIDWHRLALGPRLGEGASGVIHQADWQQPDGSLRPVAVKRFKGAVTSDGWPHSEMAACLGAGGHPNLIPVLGRIVGHPEGVEGLVLSLVDPAFTSLAGPPSLESCTRDVYPADARWSTGTALAMARGIASAVVQLHARGILHGDLYAHNILWNGQGDCLLGDFGAASFLPRDDEDRSQALQRIEVRAFGCLLEELLAHCDPTDATATDLAGMTRLKSRCLAAEPTDRPLFADIVRSLGA